MDNMRFYGLFIFTKVIFLVNAGSDDVQPPKPGQSENTNTDPLMWVLAKQNDRLQTEMDDLKSSMDQLKKNEEKNNIHWRKQIQQLQDKIQGLKKQEISIGFHSKLVDNKLLEPNEKVIFNNVIYNKGNAYDPNTGVFKAPYEGDYFFTSSFLSYYSTGVVHLQMLKNHIEISKGHGTTPGSNTGTMSAVVHLNVNDSVYVRHYFMSGKETLHGDWTYFTGFLIQRTD